MSKDKDKKAARMNAWNVDMLANERAARKVAKSERDAKAKRDKRRLASEARAAGVVAAPVDDGGTSTDASLRAPREFVTWAAEDVALVLGQAL